MKIAFIGAGNMAEAMISGMINRGSAKADEITASDISGFRLGELKKSYGIQCVENNIDAVKGKDIVVLSVKPQVFSGVSEGLRGRIGHNQLVLSIMAGIKIDTINMLLAHRAIVRVMPNTPARIAEGISVWTSTDSVLKNQKDMARDVLSSLGKDIYVEEEKYIDMATAISGSGPAYIFLIIEALIDAGVHIGLPRSIASELVMQTIIGSTRYAEASGKHMAELRDAVTSPGGTTAEGLAVLEEGGLRGILAQAVTAAYEKARELGRER